MYSGVSAFLLLDGNLAINPIVISSQKSRWAYCICLSHWGHAMQNVGIHYADVHKVPKDIHPCFYWKVTSIIFYVELIMTVYTTHVSLVQSNVLWLTYLDYIMTKPPVCVNNTSWIWIHTGKPYNSIVLPNNGHHGWVAILVWFISTPDHFTRFMDYHLGDISYSLILFHCNVFWKPVSPSITRQMLSQ